MLIPSWPEACAPTPEQWLDWLLANDRDHQLIIAQLVIERATAANLCAADHDRIVHALVPALQATVADLRDQLVDTLRESS